MISNVPFSLAAVLLSGLLAGEELAICLGVREPLASLEPQPSIAFRQALIRRLRVLVPILFVLTALAGLAAAIAGGARGAPLARWAGLGGLLVFISIAMLGTVPFNKAALSWSPDAPPDGWRSAVRRWERLDDLRTWAAIVAFACFAIAAVLG